jgi:hypothetical protein
MNARYLPPERQGSGTPGGLHDDAMSPAPAPVPASRACCCPARAVVLVVLPPVTGRPHETDLLLCGHHYRLSRRALAAAHAIVRELPGPEGGHPDAFLTDLPGRPHSAPAR